MDLSTHIPEGPPRDLYIKEMETIKKTANEHTYQMLAIYAKMSFKQITECKDMYVVMMFMSTRLAWLYRIDDPDFLKFYREEVIPMKEQLTDPFDQEVCALIESRHPPKE